MRLIDDHTLRQENLRFLFVQSEAFSPRQILHIASWALQFFYTGILLGLCSDFLKFLVSKANSLAVLFRLICVWNGQALRPFLALGALLFSDTLVFATWPLFFWLVANAHFLFLTNLEITQIMNHAWGLGLGLGMRISD